jgi:hypothetical protein
MKELTDVGFQCFIITTIRIAHLVILQRFAAQCGDDLVLQIDLHFQPRLKRVAGEIRPADAVVADLVCIDGPNASPRSPGRARAFRFFIQAI